MKKNAHAFYAPSASEEWMHCAPSVLVDTGDFNDEDDYNRHGSMLHDCGDQWLRLGSYNVATARENTGCPELVEFTEADGDSVRAYVDYVNSVPGEKRWFEVKSWFIPGRCGGTSDAVVFDPETGTLEIIDYKAGFVRRYAKANYQLMIYALGVVRKLGALYDIKRVKLTIIQPQHGDEPNSWPLKLSELERWGKRIKARVLELDKLRASGEPGEYAPEKSRCQFCKVGKALKCAEQERAGKAAATEDFADYEREAGRSIAEAEKWAIADTAEAWIKNLRESVTSRVLGGTPVEGFKAVAGRGSWVVTDKRGFIDHLSREGFKETDIFEQPEPQLLSLNKAKGLYAGKGSGKKREKLATFFNKEEGAPKVVLDSDPREALTTAEKDFANYMREGEDDGK